MYLSKDADYVKLGWNGFVAGDKYRSGVELALKFIEENDLIGWIADLREMRILTSADQDWTNTILFPKLFKTTLERMAVINSRSAVNKLAIRNIFAKTDDVITFEIHYFDDLESAMDWVAGN